MSPSCLIVIQCNMVIHYFLYPLSMLCCCFLSGKVRGGGLCRQGCKSFSSWSIRALHYSFVLDWKLGHLSRGPLHTYLFLLVHVHTQLVSLLTISSITVWGWSLSSWVKRSGELGCVELWHPVSSDISSPSFGPVSPPYTALCHKWSHHGNATATVPQIHSSFLCFLLSLLC